MKQSEFHAEIARAFKLAEDTGCWEVVKICGGVVDIREINFKAHIEGYTFALVVILMKTWIEIVYSAQQLHE